MGTKRHKPEDVIAKLREVDVLVSQGLSVAKDVHSIGVIEVNGYVENFNVWLQDELLGGKVFYTLKEAQIVIESWWCQYNAIRPHGALGYRPPAPA